jgi:hypothetical protein
MGAVEVWATVAHCPATSTATSDATDTASGSNAGTNEVLASVRVEVDELVHCLLELERARSAE